jgi:ATP/maltotriose-dependent transcriptional regulator MalT
LEKGRRAVAERAWRTAHEALVAARRAEPLGPQDLWRLALASYLIGHEQDFLDALCQAHEAFLDAGEALEAVRAAFWVGQHLASTGEVARATGWFGRAARVVDEREAEGAARGYVLLPAGHRQLMEGDYEASARTSGEAAEIGRRCRDRDLMALGIHAQGRALLRLGRLEEGLTLLDEAMVAVASDELTPVATGLIYCSVISACRDVYALRRAKEWTAALSDWCERQPDMVAYTGPCRVSRAEILQRRGEWSRAIDEARLALDRFERGSGPGSAGPALYQQGEVHRLRGEYAAAEDAYRAASRAGHEPQPGLALLRLAQGEAIAAEAALRRALAETPDALRRARLLPSYVEVLLELEDTDGAARACDELEEIARRWGGRVLATLAASARGATTLAAGSPAEALGPLRDACREWDALDAPFDAASVRVRLAAACRALGDEEGAAMELAAARATFERLGAAPDLQRLRAAGSRSEDAGHGLTRREHEVLTWLATGRTNRAIAEALSISEKTVARHVANIYGKLGLSTRAAATAYAYEHDLVRPSTPSA